MKTPTPGRTSRRYRAKANIRRAAWQVALCVAALLILGLAVYVFRERFRLLPWQQVPHYYSSAEQARPLPPTLPPAAFQDPRVARAYVIAKRIPEVLVQQPSYCLLMRRHHHSLPACFVTDDANRCQICLKESYLADELDRAGKSAAEIRASIIAGEWRSIKLEGPAAPQ